MTDVFISYSRKDKDFVRRLHDALAAHDRDTWVDWEDIPRAANWLDEIYGGIDAADTFVYVTSPDSLASEICNLEAAHARARNKRIIPIIRRDIDEKVLAGEWFNKSWEQIARDNWTTLKHLNWLFFRDTDDFEAEFHELLKAMDTDQPYLKEHTRLLGRANEWEVGGRNPAYALRGEDLTAAESWLAQSGDKDPRPTDLHTAYIFASRQLRNRQQRNLLIGITIALAITLILAATSLVLFALSEDRRAQAVSAQSTAVRQADESHSLALAANAQIALQNEDNDLAVVLALEASRIERPAPIINDVLAQVAYAPGARQRYSLQGNEGTILGLAFSPDGNTIFASTQNNLHLWDVASGQMLHTVISGDPFVISPDGLHVVTGSNLNQLIVWDVQTGAQTRAFESYDGEPITALEYSPDGLTLVSSSKNGYLALWDVPTGRKVYDLEGGANSEALAYTADGQMVVSVVDEQLTAWDTRTGVRIDDPQQLNDSGRGFYDSRANTNVVFDPGHFEYYFNVPQPIMSIPWTAVSSSLQPERFTAVDGEATGIAISPDGGKLAAMTYYGFITIWKTTFGSEDKIFRFVDENAKLMLFSPDSKMLLAATDQEMTLYNLEANAQVRNLGTSEDHPYRIAFSADSQIAIALSTHQVSAIDLWNVNTGTRVKNFYIPQAFGGDFSVDGQVMTYVFPEAGYDGPPGLGFWDLNTGSVTGTLENTLVNPSDYSQLALNSDGQYLLSATEGSIKLWDIETHEHIRDFEPTVQPIYSLKLNPEGKTALSLSEEVADADVPRELILWDVDSGKIIQQFDHLARRISSITFNPDGNSILSSSDEGLIWWQLSDGEILKVFPNFREPFVFNASGGNVLSVNNNGEVVYWDLSTGEIIHRYPSRSGTVSEVALSPNNQFAMIIPYLQDHTVLLWRLTPEPVADLIDWIHANRYVRIFTCEERLTYRVEPYCTSDSLASASTLSP